MNSLKGKYLFKLVFKAVMVLFILLITALSIFFIYARSSYYQIPVLMYHHVSPAAENKINNVTPARFTQQMQFIKGHNYEVITPYEYLAYLRGKQKITSKNMVVITFDDGYKDNFTFAYPVLKENDFPATIFVGVDKLGKEGQLTLNQIKKMQQYGVIFGSHTLNETYLPSLNGKDLEKEIKLSREKLEMITGRQVNIFAYPTGGYTKEAQDLLRKSGYLMAFTTNRGFDKSRSNNDIFALRRIKVTNKDNWFKLWVKLSGIYNLFRKVKNPY